MSRFFAFPSCLTIAALVGLPGLSAGAATLRVPGQFPTIQGAIDASRPGDVVLVGPGTYVESLNIEDKGLLTLESEAGPESTIIDGGGAYQVIRIYAPVGSHDATYHVLGFTIRNGGQCGISSFGAWTHVENNIVTGNRPSDEGYVCGAIRNMQGGGRIVHNRVEGNRTTGIWLLDPQGVVVEDNRVEGNTYRGIEAFGHYLPDSSAKFVRNIVRGNGEYEVLLTDELHLQFADNLLVGSGLAVAYFASDWDGEGLSGIVDNNTIVSTAGSQAPVTFYGRILNLKFANNIVYSGTDAPAMYCSQSVLSVPRMHHNDAFSTSGPPIHGDECVDGYASGQGNLSVDPRFDEAGDRDRWSLNAESPLVDQGDNRAVGNLRRDIRGVPRIFDGGHGSVVDMGAYEYVPK